MNDTFKIKVLLSVFFILIAVSACAEDDKSEVWQPNTPGGFVTWGAPLCGKNKLVTQPLYFFNITRGEFDGEGGYKSLPSKDYEYQQLIQLLVKYGITDCLEIDAQPSWQFNYHKEGGESAESNGFGDLPLAVRICGVEETKYLPRLTGLFEVDLPTGKYQKSDEGNLDTDITGAGSTNYTFGLNLTKGIKPILLHLDLLYTFVPSPVRIDGVKTEFSDTYEINFALEWVFYKNFNLLGELTWQKQGDRKEDGDWKPSTDQSSLVIGTGLGYSQKDWQILVGYERTVAGENVDANNTVAITAIVTF